MPYLTFHNSRRFIPRPASQASKSGDVVQHSKINLPRTASGQTTTSPQGPLCQLPPAADKPSHKPWPASCQNENPSLAVACQLWPTADKPPPEPCSVECHST